MGFVSGLLGTAGGQSGTGINGPSGTDPGQLNTAYNQTQTGIKQQQDFVNQLMQQNGLGNQASVFNQLQGVANGQGPNPAQAMLNQATGANTANQAALMAGQRGASQNPALIARQAAQQGGANQQQAAGQGATMQAQQSLGALGQLSGIAGQQVGQQQTGISALNQNSLQQQANLLGLQANINSANAGLAGQTMQGQQGLLGGLMNAGGAGIKSFFGAEGGEVPKMANGGSTPAGASSDFWQFIQNNNKAEAATPNYGNPGANALAQGMSSLANGVGSAFKSSPQQPTPQYMQQAQNPGQHIEPSPMAEGGKVPALVSPGEIRLKPHEAAAVMKGADPEEIGEKIPGEPKVKGAKNSYENDTVPKTLNEGDIILPRSVTQAKHPHWAAHQFVSAIMAKNGLPTRKKK